MDFELRLLRHALALAEHRNFARAAKAVHVSQPTLSRSIQELERRSGTRLFDRSAAGGVEATVVGLVFLEHAREVTSRASDFEREMDLMKGMEKGELHIGAGTYPGPMIVDTAVARLIGQHPSVRINITNQVAQNLIGPLRRREIDLAVIDVTTVQPDSEMHVVTLNSHQGYVVVRAGHPVLRKPGTSPVKELWEYPFVMTSRLNPAIFKEIASLFESKLAKTVGAKTLPTVGCDSLAMTKDIVRKSDAVSLMPLGEVIGEVERGELVAIPGLPWMRATFGIVRLAHRSLSPLGETFVQILKEADAELTDWEEKAAKKLFQQPRPKIAKRPR
jgi:DNA-binding transcriptional LysR family regulator